MDTGDWLEISVEVDGEAAEAISEVFSRYGRGGAVIEHTLVKGTGAHDDVDEWAVKTYIAADDLDLRRKITEALWHLGQLYPIPAPSFSVLAETDYLGCDFVDYFSVARIDGRWQITNKTYALTGGTPPGQ